MSGNGEAIQSACKPPRAEFLQKKMGNCLCSTFGKLLFRVLDDSSFGAVGNKFPKRRKKKGGVCGVRDGLARHNRALKRSRDWYPSASLHASISTTKRQRLSPKGRGNWCAETPLGWVLFSSFVDVRFKSNAVCGVIFLLLADILTLAVVSLFQNKCY